MQFKKCDEEKYDEEKCNEEKCDEEKCDEKKYDEEKCNEEKCYEEKCNDIGRGVRRESAETLITVNERRRGTRWNIAAYLTNKLKHKSWE